ncbi:MAG TPA: carbohydrate kinase family protein [Patescibacteria group bacterium]|nr:carbohydrate kinase family protein [Patescibacteria group bacterium]
MKKVMCIGSATIDILVRSNDFRVMKSHQVSGGVALCEVYGGKTEADEMVMDTGGSATNVAVGLSRLGLTPAVITRVGSDWMKERIIDNLKLEGIDISQIQEDDKTATALSVVLVAVDGGRSIITSRGAAAKIDSKKIDWEKVGSADWLQVGPLGGNLSLVEDLVAFARSKKIRVGWNPGKIELTQKERIFRLLPKIDLFIVNRMEASQLLRHNYEEMKEMAKKILDQGARVVTITDGRRGAGVATPQATQTGGQAEGRWIFAPAFKMKSVDDTGAGDAFVAGMVAGLVSGKGVEVALRMGLANGASEVALLGAKSGLLRRREMTKWLRRRVKMVEEKL